MRLTKLLVSLCVTAMAFALFGANARAATLSPGQSDPYGPVHIDDNTVFVGLLCGDESLFPNTCPRIHETFTATGTVTATAIYPTGSRITLALCAIQNPDLTPLDNCPNGTEVTSCVQTDVENTNGTTTSTLTCPVVPAGDYEVELIPTFVATCPFPPDPNTFPPCEVGPGIDVNGVITLLGTGGGTGQGGGGGQSGTAFVTSGGKVNSTQETFSAEGWNANLTRGKVMYKNNKSCAFRSTSYSFVQVTPTANSTGSAKIVGKGTVSNGKTDTPNLDFEADLQDNGEGPSQTVQDQFVLKVTGCSTAGPVISGNIQVHPSNSA